MVLMRRSVILLFAVAFASFIITIDAACVEREPVEGNVTESTMDKISYYFSEASCQLRPVVAKVKESVKEGYEYLKFKIDEYNNRNKTEVKHIKTDNITIVIINQSNCNDGQDQIIFRDDTNKHTKTNKSPGKINSEEATESGELVFRDSDEETVDVPARLPITTEQTVKTKPEFTTESRVVTEMNESIHVPTRLPIGTTVKADREVTTESKLTTELNEPVHVPYRLSIETTVNVEPRVTTESTVTKPKVTTEPAGTIVFRDDDGPINLSTGLPLKTEPTTTTETTVTSELPLSTPIISIDDRIALTVPEMCPKGEVKINGKCELEIDL